jgi:hypothetical protein
MSEKPVCCNMECLVCRLRCCGTCLNGRLFSNYPDISVLCDFKWMSKDACFPKGQQIAPAKSCVHYVSIFKR